MENVIAGIRAVCSLSDETVSILEQLVTPCSYPKRRQLVRAGFFSRHAWFIEKGMTRSYWVVDGEEITTSFSCEGNRNASSLFL